MYIKQDTFEIPKAAFLNFDSENVDLESDMEDFLIMTQKIFGLHQKIYGYTSIVLSLLQLNI